jgi:hypothetical protein
MRRLMNDWKPILVGGPLGLLMGALMYAAILLTIPGVPDSTPSDRMPYRAPATGRYQLGAAAEGTPLLLDTATGRVWRLVGADVGARWEPLAAVPEEAGAR